MPSELDERRMPVPNADTPKGADGRGAVLQKESNHPCFQCAKCCTYVAVEVDAPRTMKEYDHVVWYLYHAGVSVFVDFEGDWYVHFEARCENLTPQGLCSIYEKRPGICTDFDWRECENNIEGPSDKWLWHDADAFLAWFEERRPKTFSRYQRFLRRKQRNGTEPELGRLAIKKTRTKKR